MNFFRFFFKLRNFFFLVLKNDRKSHNLDMYLQKDYALRSKSFWIIDRNDSQVRLENCLINGIFKNWKKNLKNSELKNQFWLRKKLSYRFFCSTIFVQLIC